MTDKKTEELNEQELDQVTGGAQKKASSKVAETSGLSKVADHSGLSKVADTSGLSKINKN